jgi:hypothetical protein
MGCEHNTGWLDSACALCKNNELLESTQKENRRIADQNEKDAKANREATQSQILSNEKLAREAADRAKELAKDAADRAKELAKDAADRAEIAERAERERHEEQMRLENAKLNIEGAKAEFDSADKAWNKNQSKKTAGMYALTRRKYYHAIGKDPGFKPEPIPAIFYDYLRFPCEISDEKSVISPKEIEDEWNNAQFLSHVASLDELFSPNDPLSKTINSDAAKMLKHVQDTLHSKKNMALLEKSKKAKIEEQRIAEEQRIKEERIAEAQRIKEERIAEAQRIKEERIAAEKWEAERSIRESAEVQRKKEKPIRIISLVSTISVLLLPLLFSNARPVWAPVLFLLGVKIGRIHISQFVLPNFSGARENWIAKIRIFQINTAGLVVVIPPTVTSVYFSYLLFAAAYKNEIVAIIYSVIVGTIVILYLGERNILRLNGKQSIVDFAITLILELYNYLRYFPRNILKMFGI